MGVGGLEDAVTSCPRWCTRAGEEHQLVLLPHRWTRQREPGANKSACQVSSLQKRRTTFMAVCLLKPPSATVTATTQFPAGII